MVPTKTRMESHLQPPPNNRRSRLPSRYNRSKKENRLTHVERMNLLLQLPQKTHQQEIVVPTPQKPSQTIINTQKLQPLLSCSIKSFTLILHHKQPQLRQSRQIILQNPRIQLTLFQNLFFSGPFSRHPKNLRNHSELVSLSRISAPPTQNRLPKILMVISIPSIMNKPIVQNSRKHPNP